LAGLCHFDLWFFGLATPVQHDDNMMSESLLLLPEHASEVKDLEILG
jgi:hypothetical protein